MVPVISTPLTSTFGSGFLVVPVPASAVGLYAIVAMVMVAHQVGAIMCHNILRAEPVWRRAATG
jgi:hypothetical protein